MKKRKLNKSSVILLILFISIGFAVLATNTDFLAIANVKANKWDIHFTSVSENAKSTNPAKTPAQINPDNNKEISFYADLVSPGDIYVFNATITNTGTIDGMIESYEIGGISEEYKDIITYEINYRDGTPFRRTQKIKKGTSKDIEVTIKYAELDSYPEFKTKQTLGFTLSFVYSRADDNAKDEPSQIEQYMASMSQGPVTYEKKETGVFESVEDGEKIYLFKDENTAESANNNVLLGNMCFKIIRTTSNHNVKILYNGLYNEETGCSATGYDASIGIYSWNDDSKSPTSVAYTYGNKVEVKETDSNFGTSGYYFSSGYNYSDGQYSLTSPSKVTSMSSVKLSKPYTCLSTDSTGTCEKLVQVIYTSSSKASYIELSGGVDAKEMVIESYNGTNPSSMNSTLNDWYEQNIIKYKKYIGDASFCNSKEYGNSNLSDFFSPSYSFKYVNFINESKNKYDISCADEDKYSVSNNKLKYPVGLLSYEEVNLSGHNVTSAGHSFWTMTPSIYQAEYSPYVGMYVLTGDDNWSTFQSSMQVETRPVISLNNNATFYEGNGSITDPYKIELK